jgi:hypothetical protein
MAGKITTQRKNDSKYSNKKKASEWKGEISFLSDDMKSVLSCWKGRGKNFSNQHRKNAVIS